MACFGDLMECNYFGDAKPDSLLTAVQEVLFREWDPIGVNENESCRDEYDAYAGTICRWLREGVDEHKLESHLSEIQWISMGISSIDKEANRKIARRLLALVSPTRGTPG